LSKAAALAIRELATLNEVGSESRDLAAFLVLALQRISETVEESVLAWEKRGYWVKADRFRMDWAWSAQAASKLKAALLADDWTAAASVAAQIAIRLQKITISPNHRLGRPWVGAWSELKKQQAGTRK
jgi:hypothetical protein